MKYRYIRRLAYIPIGIINGIIKFMNNNARDIENKHRFPHAIIDEGSTFTNDSTIGENTHILGNCIINHCTIGKFTYVGRNSLIQNANIGNYCSIANDVIIGLGRHPIDKISTSPIFYRKKNPLNIEFVKDNSNFHEYLPIIIENDIWIGARATIMDGVTIGTGAVIAACAVVTKNVPPYAIVAGIPAKIIKFRFENTIVEKLINANCWEQNPNDVKKILDNIIG